MKSISAWNRNFSDSEVDGVLCVSVDAEAPDLHPRKVNGQIIKALKEVASAATLGHERNHLRSP